MNIAKILTAGLMGLAVAVPSLGEADDRTKLQAQVDENVKAALATPVTALGDKVMTGSAQDWLRLGLAMLAGRGPGRKADDAEAAQLQALDARVMPLIGDYLKAHPGSDPARVNWSIVVKETPEEADFVETYEQVHSADYWLQHALFATTHFDITHFQRPDIRYYSGGPDVGGRQSSVETDETARVLPANLVFVAAHCIVAARRAADVDYQAWSTLPLSVRLLQTLPRNDMQARVDADVKASITKYATGTAACGTDEQFKADLETLKTAKP